MPTGQADIVLKLTLDTGCLEHSELRDAAKSIGADVASFSVARKEMTGTDYLVHLTGVRVLAEQSMFVDVMFSDGFWADRFFRSGPDVAYRRKDGAEVMGDPFEDVLDVISNGSFPNHGHRRGLTDKQRNQFRDAMMLSLHAQHRRDVFVTADTRAFIQHGRREKLERMLGTRIRTPSEVVSELTG